MSTRQSRGPRPAARSGAEAPDMTELGRDLAASWEQAMMSGLACYESWLKIVSSPFNGAFGFDGARLLGAGADGERRASGLPWVPQFDTKVIPFRRATDPPGAEGSRITMRMAMPAVFGASAYTNVLSVDTLVPMPQADESEPAPAARRMSAAGG